MIVTGVVSQILMAVESAEKLCISGLRDGTIETEPSLTDRFLGALLQSVESQNIESDGYRVTIRTLRDRGPNSPEKEFGADLVSVLHADSPEFHTSKGFLAQAKTAGKNEIHIDGWGNGDYPVVTVKLSRKDDTDIPLLQTQCRQMLRITAHSYVFVYSHVGIYVVSANTISGMSTDGIPHRVYVKSIRQFFRDHLMSFIGDNRIRSHDDETLRILRQDTFANSALLLSVEASNNAQTKFPVRKIRLGMKRLGGQDADS